MRRRRISVTLLPVVLLLLVIAPVSAQEEDESCRPLSGDPDADPATDPFICETPYFLQCDTAVGGKVQVLAPVVSPNAQFNATPPSGQFTAGAGCGELENSQGRGVVQDNIHDFTFEGTVHGNVDSFSVELHDFYLSPSRTASAATLGIRVAVDGQSPFGTETVTVAGTTFEAPRFIDVSVQPQLSSTQATASYRFTVTGLHAKLNTANRPGVSTVPRHIKITVDTPFDGAHGIVWGAVEIPSGLTINPKTPVGTVVPATGG